MRPSTAAPIRSRLLVADVEDDTLTEVERRMEIVRLGQGVDETGRLAPEALERTFAAMRGYRKLIDQHRASGHQGGRDQRHPRRGQPAGVRRRRAGDLRGRAGGGLGGGGGRAVVHRRDQGPGAAVAGDGGAAGTAAPYLVVDIGGGSTEFVVGSAHAEAAVSVDIGCVRLTERHLRAAGDPPSATALEAVVADIEAALDRVEAEVPVRRAHTLVGLAGSVTTVAGIALDLPAYDPERIHHSRISAEQVHEVTRRLLSMTHGERAAVPVMHPGRIDVIGVGSLILDRVVRRFEFPQVVVSEHDILDGIAWSIT